ncbi:hypothetical protein H0H81_007498 [Sphagnurus paluster]|uniref:Uncharacterized protein n=1 Tax=Sphagnurus paluster TaxID=117069 RepID=A0A9P7GNW3_9AGAR|nr:hypothetical protein H0H81_007498 [Sphagnurus paluster]
MITHCPELPLYAPAPVPGQPSPLLFSGTDHYYNGSPIQIPLSANQFSYPLDGPPPTPTTHHVTQNNHQYIYPGRPQATFPTPSEMLSELVGGAQAPSTAADVVVDGKSEPVRKTRRRNMAQNIGFMPTDPCAANLAPARVPESQLVDSRSDPISSHEKKRHYLECLEYYVLYLHEQLRLVGANTIPLQRVHQVGRGMSSRSIRTLLVHMESVNRGLSQQMLAEEQRVGCDLPLIVYGN